MTFGNDVTQKQADEINGLQSGAVAAEGMPDQAADIAPVEVSLARVVREVYELKARFNYLEARYNQLCKEKSWQEYATSSIA